MENNNNLEQSEQALEPKYDMTFDSYESAYEFYNDYARRIGFSIRKECIRYGKDRVETSRVFVCCKEGVRKKRTTDDVVKNPRAETRTGCDASMGVRLNRHSNKFYVYRFSKEHNHPLLPQDYVQLLPSHRKVTETDSAFIDLTANSGVSQKASFELLGQQAGGRQSLGFTSLDQKNYLRTVRQKKMRFGEAGYLMEYFSKQALENPSFFFEMQFDSEEQITNIFWADAKMIMDYGLFGDVVSFDTTYKINEANRPLAVFVGLNHHRQTVVFGAALMYDETESSFIWLFEIFLKAMCGKSPKTIFTDQDAAIAKALLHVMPDAYHRLCIWHLMQNAVKKVGFLFKNPNVGKEGNALSKFLYQIEDESEFLSAWKSMLDEYKAHDDHWLTTTFEIRKKWAYTYVKWTWSAGMQTTQLSESFNASLKGYLKSNMQLPEFFTHFEIVICDKRYKEEEAEYDLLFRTVHCKIDVSILLHAREVYTKTIYKLFEAEFEESLKYIIKKFVQNDEQFIFTVARDGSDKERVVTRDGEFKVCCSCMMFDMVGILCRHCIKVMVEGRETTLIKKIPEQYILQRWTKTARVNTVVKDLHGMNIVENPKLKQTCRYRSLCSKVIRLASRASECEKTYEIANAEVDKVTKMVEDLLHLEINGDKDMEDQNNLAQHSNAKGFRKKESTHRGKRRAKGNFEVALSKNKKKTTQGGKVVKHGATRNQSHVPSSPTSLRWGIYGLTTYGRFNYVKLYVVDVFSRFYVYEPRDVKEKAVLIDVFSKYGMNPALASNEE